MYATPRRPGRWRHALAEPTPTSKARHHVGSRLGCLARLRLAGPDGGSDGRADHIDPPLYALDVLVPLLDLRQEQRCTVSALDGSWFWRVVKVMYAVLGWIVVTRLVLTASGVVRRQVEQ